MRYRSERGATLVHVGFMMIGLFAMSAFAIDNGAFYVARRQAQNAADAGAHAGAVARAFNDLSANPPTGSGMIYDSVVNTVALNSIWGVHTPASATVISYTCPPGFAGACVRVDVHRDGTLGSASMPTMFLKLAGVTTQPVRATATATYVAGNGTHCLKPWMIPDWFDDQGPAGYDPSDTYVAPGYNEDDHLGVRVTLHGGPGQSTTPSDYNAINDVGGSNSGAVYEQNIRSCNLTGWIGKTMSDVTGGKQGPTRQGVNYLIDQDPTATWDGTRITGPYGMSSPRVVIIAMYSPVEYYAERQQGNGNEYTITNLMSIFLEDVNNGGDITGIIVANAGEQLDEATGEAPEGAVFTRLIQLIR